jgi:hypothetical protein
LVNITGLTALHATNLSIKSVSTWYHTICFKWYSHHQLLKLSFDGNCCASLTVAPASFVCYLVLCYDTWWWPCHSKYVLWHNVDKHKMGKPVMYANKWYATGFYNTIFCIQVRVYSSYLPYMLHFPPISISISSPYEYMVNSNNYKALIMQFFPVSCYFLYSGSNIILSTHFLTHWNLSCNIKEEDSSFS